LRWSTWSVLSGGSVFEDVAASLRVNLAVRGTDQDIEVLSGRYVSSSWLRLLGVSPVRGRLFQPAEDAQSEDIALISFSVWQRRFGTDERVIGQSIRLSYSNPNAPIRAYRVVGILPRH